MNLLTQKVIVGCWLLIGSQVSAFATENDATHQWPQWRGPLATGVAPNANPPPGAFRLGPLADIYASPVGAAGRVYFTDRRGRTLVISNSDDPQALALNQLNDEFSASAAVVGDLLFLRGAKYLYCLGEEGAGE